VKLANARRELERGHLKQALKLAWQEGLEAADRADANRLDTTQALANAIAERATGRLQDDARMLASYCASARTNPRNAGPCGRHSFVHRRVRATIRKCVPTAASA
jgi:hypothetical protein